MKSSFADDVCELYVVFLLLPSRCALNNNNNTPICNVLGASFTDPDVFNFPTDVCIFLRD